jgi:hypothetical protein
LTYNPQRGKYHHPGHFSMKIPGQLSAEINTLSSESDKSAASGLPKNDMITSGIAILQVLSTIAQPKINISIK